MDEIGEFDKGAVKEASERLKAFSKFFPKKIGVSTIVHPKDEICTNFENCEAIMEWRYKCPNCKDNFYPSRASFFHDDFSTSFSGILFKSANSFLVINLKVSLEG
jgi:hypothetical protein